jgi:hypothetical protein
MTKPQTTNEPSMEDILASIRKMISEDRLDARPIPDQIARASIGERATPRPVPKPVGQDRVEKAQSDAKPVSAPPTAVLGEPPGSERSVPSFSSLSDALKSAAPGSVRAPLDGKLSNMLNEEGKPGSNGRDGIPPSAPLAVFAGSRAPSAASAKPQLQNGSSAEKQVNESRAAAFPEQAPLTAAKTDADPERAVPSSGARVQSTLKPVPEKQPTQDSRPSPLATNGAALNGSSVHKSAAPSIATAAASTVSEIPAADRDDSLRTTRMPLLKSEIEHSIEAPKVDTQRIIAMPARFPMSSNQTSSGQSESSALTNGSEVNGAQNNGALAQGAKGALNGSGASVFGLRPAGAPADGARPRTDIGARLDEVVKPELVNLEVSSARAASSIGAAPHVLKVDDADSTEARVHIVEQKPDAKEPSDALEAFKRAVAEHHNESSAKQAVGGGAATGPSESLVDAVMDLVHAEPGTLSVFASGSSFIHGVGSSHHVEAPVKVPEPALPEEPANPVVAAPKLDRSAAELLRPMLRQWLADNMPRIVEDALRSELTSGQGDRTPEKG